MIELEDLSPRLIAEPSGSFTWVYNTRFQCTGSAPAAPSGYRLRKVHGLCMPWAAATLPPIFDPAFPPAGAVIANVVDMATLAFKFVNSPSLPDWDKDNWQLSGANSNAGGTAKNSVGVWYMYSPAISGPGPIVWKVSFEVKDFLGKTLTTFVMAPEAPEEYAPEEPQPELIFTNRNVYDPNNDTIGTVFLEGDIPTTPPQDLAGYTFDGVFGVCKPFVGHSPPVFDHPLFETALARAEYETVNNPFTYHFGTEGDESTWTLSGAKCSSVGPYPKNRARLWSLWRKNGDSAFVQILPDTDFFGVRVT